MPKICYACIRVPSITSTLLSAHEVAALLRVAPRTVRVWAEQGKFHATKVGRLWRFSSSDIAKLVEHPSHNKVPAALPQLPLKSMTGLDPLEALRDLLKLGVTQKQIAKALGIRHSTVSRWVSQTVRISEGHVSGVWDLLRQVRQDRLAQVMEAGSTKLLFPRGLTEERGREILLATLSEGGLPSDATHGTAPETLVAALRENLYVILLRSGTNPGTPDSFLHELTHLVDRLRQERGGS